HACSVRPVVLDTTEGESPHGDPTVAAGQISTLASSDGNVLLFNCHLSSERASKIEYPSDPSNLPNEFARTLFTMSSPLPAQFIKAARETGIPLSEGARGFVFNADAASLVQFFEIGTRPAN